MKKIIVLSFLISAIFCLTACSDGSESANQNTTSADPDNTESVDIDLSGMDYTMLYSYLTQMYNDPYSYQGKTVKMSGLFSVSEAETRNYYFCYVADATACCSATIEFVLEDNLIYPDEYPAVNSDITVSGMFDIYWEGDYMYCQLSNAILE